MVYIIGTSYRHHEAIKKEKKMNKHMDWLKVSAIIIFMMLMGGYYDRFSLETRTMILPLVIFIAATYFFVHLRKIQMEMRASNVIAYKLVANELSLVDNNGNERISVTSNNGAITFYDDNQVPLATINFPGDQSMLKLTAEGGSAELSFDQERAAIITLRDKTEDVIWSAP
jgi:hypothetical protein